MRLPAGYVLAVALAALLPAIALGQTPAAASDGSAPAQQISTEVLIEPRMVKRLPIDYPEEEVRANGEGWVYLGLMVDPTGKPFEVTVDSSSGNKVFEKEAIEAMEHARYKPGMLNGQPVESATEFKVIFVLHEQPKGARPQFVGRYQAVQKAIRSNDREAADAAMKRLDVNNLYEDAFFGLISYAYALAWGDESQQLAGVQRALANESTDHYLPPREFASLRLAALILDVQLRHYAEAAALWPGILKSDISPAAVDKLRPMIHQLEQVRLMGQPYDVAGSMLDGTWHLGLFEPNFRIRVSQGHISQVKLRCRKGFVRFNFDPDIEYKVGGQYGTCKMELNGTPGTSFTLTQF
jgi:TonB family protein